MINIDYIIASFDALGAIAFLVAGIISICNYKRTKFISSYWQIFSIAAFLAAFWAGSVSLEWFGFAAVALDSAQQAIIAAAITAFSITAIIGGNDLARPE